DEAPRLHRAHERGDLWMQQRLGPIVETDRLDAAFAQRLVDPAEEVGAHQPAGPLAQITVAGADEAGRAAQIAVRKNVDVEDEALLGQRRFVPLFRHQFTTKTRRVRRLRCASSPACLRGWL